MIPSFQPRRVLAGLGGLSLDLKLGIRMLVKYPGLTIVGGLAISFAIWIGAVVFELVTLIVHPALPLPGGDRIVQIQSWDVAESRAEPRAVYDFLVWREALRAVTELGAYHDATRNVIGDDGTSSLVQVAEVTSSAFQIAPVIPVLGRVLDQDDERAGAPPVVVLGYELWRNHFGGDIRMVGRTIHVGDGYATVAGVMPSGFAFPVSHELWMPLRLEQLDRAPRSGTDITIFGRLAPGVSLRAAQSELTAIGRRTARDVPRTHAYLQPRIARYATLFWNPSQSERGLLASFNLFAVMLVVLLSGNVALLMFARAATRENELILRSAIGASRRRIIAQLFAEALVLGGAAAAAGLAAAAFGLRHWGRSFLELNMGRLPFWVNPHLSPLTVAYAIALTVVAAAIAGVVPALKVTRGIGSRLRQGSAGGLRFGGVWTAVIITQVAITVAFPVVAFVEQGELRRIQTFDMGFAAKEYLAIHLSMDTPAPSGADTAAARTAQRVRFGAALDALQRRVGSEPGVVGVSFVDRLPRLSHPERMIELDEPTALAVVGTSTVPPSREVSIASVDPSYFDVLGAPILAGRAFVAGDGTHDTHVMIVDQGFVNQVLGGRNPIGRRLRFAETPTTQSRGASGTQPWYEIVGVVKELGMQYVTERGRTAGVYLPASMANAASINMVVHVRGSPLSFVPTARTVAAQVDPALRLSDMQQMSQVTDDVQWILRLWLEITVVLTAIALLLSLAGIYAVLSFTVSRRTREIGVRVALGANRIRVVIAVFRRPLTQVSLGVVAGGILVAAMALVMTGVGLTAKHAALLVGYSIVMMGVCLLACIVPTRRALRVEPTVALRAE